MAVPRPVLQVADGQAEVLYDGEPRWVRVFDIPDLVAGEYVVVYAGQALDRVPKEEAEEILSFYDDLERMLEEAAGGG